MRLVQEKYCVSSELIEIYCDNSTDPEATQYCIVTVSIQVIEHYLTRFQLGGLWGLMFRVMLGLKYSSDNIFQLGGL